MRPRKKDRQGPAGEDNLTASYRCWNRLTRLACGSRGILYAAWRRVRGKLSPVRYGMAAKSQDFLYDGPPPRGLKEMGPIEQYFWSSEDLHADKWLSFLPVYDRYFAPFEDKPVRVLEIGVQGGDSLRMWREFFGRDAVIFGVDIDPRCASLDGDFGQVRIGSQADASFLQAVVEEMGGVDIVIDDGSHQMEHIKASFIALFPLLADGGIYLVEDLGCSYWANFGGGRGRPGTFLELVKCLIDDVHHNYHDGHVNVPAAKDRLLGIHIYDQIVVLEKGSLPSPKRAIRRP